MDKEAIENEVVDMIKGIAKAMGVNAAKADTISMKTKLWEDLGFSTVLRGELARPLNEIVERNGGKRISKAEAGKFEMVQDACDLVNKKIEAGKGGAK